MVVAGAVCLTGLMDMIDDNSKGFARGLNLDNALSGRTQTRAVQCFVLAISKLEGFSGERCVGFGLVFTSKDLEALQKNLFQRGK